MTYLINKLLRQLCRVLGHSWRGDHRVMSGTCFIYCKRCGTSTHLFERKCK